MHAHSLLLHDCDISRKSLVKIKLLIYTRKLGITIFWREVIKSKGEISLMEVINVCEIIDTIIRTLGLFLHKSIDHTTVSLWINNKLRRQTNDLNSFTTIIAKKL